ncbi:MAG: aldehyde reductase [Chlorobiaceae bacterium]|nr:aldehyde reductase [Chlorobiaceae bacterium]
MITEKPVCLTGASGFIAAHILRELLVNGYRVRGTVRKKPENYPYLLSLPGAAERLELVNADLLLEGSFDKAVEGCEYVIHTASPFEINVGDPQTDLVDPAVNGTETLMDSCRKARSVRRVVLTSSIAAITDEPESSKVFTEEDWNTMSSLDRNPYYYSKTLAEHAAWDFIMRTKPGFDLVVINPFLVLGPSLGPSISTSCETIRDLMVGVYPAIMDLNWGIVDVRDVAKAHLAAMENKEASGRYLCSGDSMHMRELIGLLRSSGYEKGYALPKPDLSGTLGSVIIKGLSFTQPKNIGKYLRTHVGRTMRFDNAKIRRELGISFIPAKTSVIDTVEDMLKWGHLKPAKI